MKVIQFILPLLMKLTTKFFKSCRSKEVNCIFVSEDISRSLLLEKLSLVPSHISYAAALLQGFCSETLASELVEVMSGSKSSGYACSIFEPCQDDDFVYIPI